MRRAAALAMALVAAGCASETAEESLPAETADPPRVGQTACEAMTAPFDTFRSDIEKVGRDKLVTLRLDTATPAPPNLGDNAWMVEVIGADATITNVEPFMPAHGHGVSIAPTAECDGNMCEVSAIDFMMPGVWEVRFDVETVDAATDRVVFSFCIEG